MAPQQRTGFKRIEVSKEALQILRFDRGEGATWRELNGIGVQFYFFEWQPGRSAATLARNHTPEICLPSAGRKITGETSLTIPVRGLELPFRQFSVESASHNSRDVQVFYCLWEDRAAVQSLTTELLTWRNRFRNVLEGRRNLGQRILHVAIAGARSPADARDQLRRILEECVVLGPSKTG